MTAALAGVPLGARAAVIEGALPWFPEHTAAPPVTDPVGWRFFTPSEAGMVEALVDRLIPPDPETPGGKDAGCAVFIDRQLAGPYGQAEANYNAGPHHDGSKQQGEQSAASPAQHYRQALRSLDKYCQAVHHNPFTALTDEQKDKIIAGLENGSVDLGDKRGGFFKQLLKDTRQGFFADPVYGGNRDMCAWKMIGFPGAHYDYRDWVERHNEHFPLPPVGIADHPDWKG
jgi:gluconate 2-dehydrogenase gamma chain